MEFDHKEVLAALILKHDIATQHENAFRARIQNMQRLGFPSGVNTGKGRPARYTWRELFLLGLAFEYLELGSTPDRCAAEITKFEDPLLRGIAEVILAKGADDPQKMKFILYAELSALLTLKAQDKWHQQCNILSLDDIANFLSEDGDDGFRSPYALVDLRQLIGGLVSSMIIACGLNNEIISKDIKLWAQRYLQLTDEKS